MPIVTIECVISDNSDKQNEAELRSLTDSLGEVFSSPPGGTWVRMHYLDQHDYAENRTNPKDTPTPTFVHILMRELPSLDDREKLAKQIAEVTSNALRRSRDLTHVIFEPEGFGRVAFGGNLLVR